MSLTTPPCPRCGLPARVVAGDRDVYGGGMRWSIHCTGEQCDAEARGDTLREVCRVWDDMQPARWQDRPKWRELEQAGVILPEVEPGTIPLPDLCELAGEGPALSKMVRDGEV